MEDKFGQKEESGTEKGKDGVRYAQGLDRIPISGKTMFTTQSAKKEPVGKSCDGDKNCKEVECISVFRVLEILVAYHGRFECQNY